MKIGILTLLLSGFFWLSLPPTAPVEWQSSTTHDFGDLERGTPKTIHFTFLNTGSDSLYIDNVRTACGCTSPEWADVKVAPDSLGHIAVEYDAEDAGYFNKWIKVYFNGYRKAEKLFIEGWVEQ